MRIFVDNVEHRLWFRYITEFKDRTVGTKATLLCLFPELGAAEHVGFSQCSPKDNFNKETGRKIALARTLTNAFTKEQRTQVWRQYFARRYDPTGEIK
jgi:hypothetical protein